MRLGKYITETSSLEIENGPYIWGILTTECRPFLREYKKTGFAGKKWIYRGSDKTIPSKNRGIKAFIPRTNRRPKDMDTGLHNIFDEAFNSMFGWYARSEGVFTTSNKSVAGNYGKPYIFVPEGRYRYVWSDDVDDLYGRADDLNLHMIDSDQAWYDDFELEQDYNEQFGRGSGNGHWEYDGEEVGDYRSDYEDVKAEMEMREGEDFDVFAIEWIPEMTFDDYFEEKNQEKREELERELEDVMRTYRAGNLKGAISMGHEITFDCKAYYLIEPQYGPFLKEMITKGVFQLKLPFPPYGTTTPPNYFAYNKKGKMVYNDPI
jgi:hypothetical protein